MQLNLAYHWNIIPVVSIIFYLKISDILGETDADHYQINELDGTITSRSVWPSSYRWLINEKRAYTLDYSSSSSNAAITKIPIGILFSKQTHGEFHQAAFVFAVNFHNNRFNFTNASANMGQTNAQGIIRLVPIIGQIDGDNPFQAIHELCLQLNRGIMALIIAPSGLESSFRTITTYASTFKLPIIFTDSNHEDEPIVGTATWSASSSVTTITGSGNNPVVSNVPSHYQFGSTTFGIHPDVTSAVVDVIKHYRWKNIIYLYETNNGFHRLLKILNLFNANSNETLNNIQLRMIFKLSSVEEANEILRRIELQSPMSPKHVILACRPLVARAIIVNLVQDIMIGRRNFHFVIPNLVMDDYFDVNVTKEFSAINITGFRVELNRDTKFDLKQFVAFIRNYPSSQLNLPQTFPTKGTFGQSPSNKGPILSSDAAFLFDSVKIVSKIFSQMPNINRPFKSRGSQTNIFGGQNNWFNCGLNNSQSISITNTGEQIRQRLLKIAVNGLTGKIEFNSDGTRKSFSIEIVETSLNRKAEKIGNWNMEIGFDPLPTVPTTTKTKENDWKLKTFYVTSILAEPYLMLKTDEENLVGNNRFEGYCKDLCDLIAARLNISYELNLVKDSKYGGFTNTTDGNKLWNGMVGELIRNEADIAIAPLTITVAREEVIDFTKPFMSLGISIMIKKPQKKNPGIFSFMDPLSSEIWLCIMLSYVGVAVVLYVVSRFSPYEWRYEETVYGPHVSNDFSLYNSLWFALGAIMQQGCDVYPRSVAGRIVGSVWWFFTLILLSTYTANLAAFLTVERMVAPINSADDLAKQTEVEYGVLRDSSSMEFFKRSKIAVHQRMWDFMNIRKNVFVDSYKEGIQRVRESKGKYAFLIESAHNDYVNERLPCDTLKVGRNLDAKGYGLATPRGSPIKDKLNLAVLFLIENGDMTRLENRWWYDRSECKSREQKETMQNALTMNNVAGCFYILVSGLVVALIVALGDFLLKAKTDSSKLNVSISEAIKSMVITSITGRPSKIFRNMELKENMETEQHFEDLEEIEENHYDEMYRG